MQVAIGENFYVMSLEELRWSISRFEQILAVVRDAFVGCCLTLHVLNSSSQCTIRVHGSAANHLDIPVVRSNWLSTHSVIIHHKVR